METVFYDQLAPHAHLLYGDWERFMTWQTEKIGRLVAPSDRAIRIVDCAAGIGTNTIPLAGAGHDVLALDTSVLSIERARSEAARRGVDMRFHTGAPDQLSSSDAGSFHVALILDNYLCHATTDEEAVGFLVSARKLLRNDGRLVVALRDYDADFDRHPDVDAVAFHSACQQRRIVHQIWDWLDDHTYQFHLHIVRGVDTGWEAMHFTAVYRALRRTQAIELIRRAGFRHVEVVSPEQSGYHRFLLLAAA
ncbi:MULTISPECIES: class I SAM-dependent methyltransferase [Burkholderia]|uniref:Class I SAM-dependent methyltransferase n=1 Tax=Burkholderia contaminans TaxID=488447 RepID=A0A250LJ45_9BURK|nr:MULTISPECIES: class I SAM-dependent methyltransferase [Burkholderia]UTP27161.1 class I SAM-dependent methyltransferase [Burkholderia sp. FXe9]MBA9832904.1 class I SAM-dependent methyltransferase [Burkholderia contaminans]MBA9909017.1 class I SAM-dependent methyltransferase [Burkholderia contaminans]MBH9693095.1 class I SAM-dependent methyltransferase [Burkholderia contaminans]MBK1906212.1 class I SAM-dependent methyltransferase [Burkholderia contaminans]